MAEKITISDFKIKVRLDSGAAAAGLRKLQTYLNKISDSAKKNIKIDKEKLNNQKEQTKEETKQNKVRAAGLSLIKGMGKGVLSLGKFALKVGAVMVGALGFVSAIASLKQIKGIIEGIIVKGATVHQGLLALRGAVAGTASAGKMDKAAIKKLQREQIIFVEQLSKKMGVSLAGTASNFAKFFAASADYIGTKGSQDLFTAMSELGIVYGLDQEKMDRAFNALTQMASKNQVMAEELKQQLGDVLPGAMEIFSRAASRMYKKTVTVADLYDLMAKGALRASDMFPFVTEILKEQAAPELAKAFDMIHVKLGGVKWALETLSAGALSQFSDKLGEIYDRAKNLFSGRAMQIGIGRGIKNLIGWFGDVIDPAFDTFEQYEKEFNAAQSYEEQKKVVDKFWSANGPIWKGAKGVFSKFIEKFGKLMGDIVTYALNSITEEDLAAFKDTVFNMFKWLFQQIIDLIFGAGTFDKWYKEAEQDTSWSGARSKNRHLGGVEARQQVRLMNQNASRSEQMKEWIRLNQGSLSGKTTPMTGGTFGPVTIHVNEAKTPHETTEALKKELGTLGVIFSPYSTSGNR